MSLAWKYVKPLKNEDAVREFLHRVQVVLPEKLVQYLTEYNGGRPSEPLFDTNEGREYVFKSLMSYNGEDIERIDKAYPGLFADTTLYPIATDAGGNFICYDIDTKQYILWKHETGTREVIKTNAVFPMP